MDLEIKSWIDKIDQLKLPRWDDLPNIGLYFEQVLYYVNEHLSSIFLDSKEPEDFFVTASMINNYVKHKIMVPPVKKKYYQAHIAFIFTITILKQVGNLKDVHGGITHLRTVLGKEQAFDTFIDFLETSLHSVKNELLEKPDGTFYEKAVSIDLLPLKTATIAFASSMLSRYLFSKIKK
ncbi:DUF1836 domain-containing protein [Acholeplasma equirhinis]|uniref:DUF1836 domain-containing protein n=1 Tax=Acholeplasma equirhinis TaxID=555393 RepID=UPI00197AEC83|nr:DUF1836 domain-containing protein [Acholeplasma equirhinis]MBN3490079.1 DUF1836 domain-containing protein [Acholeplasma equirhinis]